MGNSSSAKFSPLHGTEKKISHSNNCVVDKQRILTIDPRSPSEGIPRTPIRVDKYDSFFDDSTATVNGIKQKSEYSSKSPTGGGFTIDLNTFETLDAVLTEDDSIHRDDVAEEGASALSDTKATEKLVSHDNVIAPDSVPHGRLSWMDRLSKRKSITDSPSLFVRLRQKHDYEKRRKSVPHHPVRGDNVSQKTDSHREEHFRKSEEPVIT
ncbi:unnamed protein product [Calicophoron daubneyi]|uniref:Uncharacterized protein n=1 Tax=Calicophoron daubneyi TaxID=300641 RepID=A0AAV2TCG5_CALDB